MSKALRRQDIIFDDKDRALSHDVNMLGALIGELIREQGDDTTLQRAIILRNPYVDPMSFIQVDLLARWRASNYEDEELFSVLLTSVNGIAQGLRNTG